MPDIVINGFLHLVGYRTIVCHFRKDSGLKLFYGHVLWGLGPVYGYLRFSEAGSDAVVVLDVVPSAAFSEAFAVQSELPTVVATVSFMLSVFAAFFSA